MKILIFDNALAARKFSERVHTFMSENRPRYNASEWSKPNKSDNAQRWMVKIPYDARRWAKKLVERIEDDKYIRIATRLPDNWRNEIVL
jgi:hypothetical protein